MKQSTSGEVALARQIVISLVFDINTPSQKTIKAIDELIDTAFESGRMAERQVQESQRKLRAPRIRLRDLDIPGLIESGTAE